MLRLPFPEFQQSATESVPRCAADRVEPRLLHAEELLLSVSIFASCTRVKPTVCLAVCNEEEASQSSEDGLGITFLGLSRKDSVDFKGSDEIISLSGIMSSTFLKTGMA